jgi:hypothetical protein
MRPAKSPASSDPSHKVALKQQAPIAQSALAAPITLIQISTKKVEIVFREDEGTGREVFAL